MKRLLILMTLMLTACSGGKAVAPLGGHYGDSRTQQQQTRASANAPFNYVVRKGDTLYSISFRYGMDYRDLARANGIGPPYTIYVGQKLKLRGATTTQRTRVAASQPKATAPKSVPKTQTATAPPPKSVPKTSSPAAKPAETSSKSIPSTPSGTANPAWRWPTKGPLLSSFSDAAASRKGIKIAGKAGQDVIASAAGRVVYSGNGLPRYGNLLIIKHNDVYLSAYAHNESLLVKEGDNVQSGQKIATLGRTGTQRDQLHFEIRRNGKPVDPMRYLPKQ